MSMLKHSAEALGASSRLSSSTIVTALPSWLAASILGILNYLSYRRFRLESSSSSWLSRSVLMPQLGARTPPRTPSWRVSTGWDTFVLCG